MPLVFGAGPLGAAAAQRWKTQVNENAKAPAFASGLPELCHNEIVGWGQHGDMTRQVFTLVELRHDEEHPQEARRFELMRDVMAEVVHDVIEVQAEGEGPLAQLLDLVLFGDFVSLHMAEQEGIDPGPEPVTDIFGP
jgi:glucose/mannose-6-phosphate isomerase